jgi:hypothetical protein
MELGETTEQAAQREAREEACATIEIDRLLAMYSVARIGQVQIMYRRRLVSATWRPGPRARTWRWSTSRHPVGAARLPDRGMGAAHFHDSRGKADFATYSNPTGDLAKMWPPRNPQGCDAGGAPLQWRVFSCQRA